MTNETEKRRLVLRYHRRHGTLAGFKKVRHLPAAKLELLYEIISKITEGREEFIDKGDIS